MKGSGGSDYPHGVIRAIDPFRDLEDVVDLIGVAFGDRLDPAARATLERMRRFARRGPLMQWLWALAGKAAMAPGLVWLVDSQVVGNVSLRRARGGDGYLIGNVVVHPDYRGRGIARALMNRAIAVLSRRGVPWVGLEVRAGNLVARGLYSRMAFREVGRTTHMLWTPRPVSRTGKRARGSMRRGQRRDGEELVELMKCMVPEEQRPLVEVVPADYRPSWERRFDHWLRGEDEVWWLTQRGASISGAIRAVRKRGRIPHRLELLIRPGREGEVASDLVRQGLSALGGPPGKAVDTSVPNATQLLVAALEGQGFRELRVLIQMKRDLKQGIPVHQVPDSRRSEGRARPSETWLEA